MSFKPKSFSADGEMTSQHRRIVARSALGVSSFAIMALAATAPQAGNVMWTDHLTSLNSSRWSVPDGWTDGPWMLNNWRASQIATNSSGLYSTFNVAAPGSSNAYSSGSIQANPLFRYGYFVARMQSAPGSGFDTGFFTYTGPSMGATWNEIDVEITGLHPNVVELSYHNGNKIVTNKLALSFDASKSAHLFGFDWEPGYIRWYIDNKLVHQDTGSQLPLPNEPQKLGFEAWGSNPFIPWLGPFVWPGRPVVAHAACIAVAPRFNSNLGC